MIRFHDLSDKEILQLSDEEIDRYVDIECAFAGAPLLPLIPEKPTLKKPEPDLEVYEVKGMIFRTAEAATRVLSVLCNEDIFDTEYSGSDYSAKRLRYLPDYHKPKVEVLKVFSAEKFDKIKKDLESYNSANRIYEERKKEYKEAVEARADINTKIWDKAHDIRAKNFKRESIKLNFERYLQLANNDRQIAINFLTAIESIPEDLKQELLEDVETSDD